MDGAAACAVTRLFLGKTRAANATTSPAYGLLVRDVWGYGPWMGGLAGDQAEDGRGRRMCGAVG